MISNVSTLLSYHNQLLLTITPITRIMRITPLKTSLYFRPSHFKLIHF
jgi:hypothetical protein